MGLFQDQLETVDGGSVVNLRDFAGNGLTSTNNAGKQSLDVNITGGSSSAAVADKTTYTYGTTNFQSVGGVFQDTSPALTAGQSGAFRLTANRAIHLNLRDASGNELGATNAAGVFVRPGDGTNTQAYSATNEAFTQIRQGGNIATVNASGQLATADANSALINGKMSPATATLSQVAVAAVTTAVIAANAARKGLVIVNEGISIVKLAFAATATTTAYSYKLAANSTLELLDNRVPTGQISHIGSVATGNLVITEFT